ncbi:hypothetical protein ABC383_17640 [Noviherbaspirillum sp. 1P10PC]|uniref:hypothetical protein n=1 Tax=Noviherbaspirillum sp. 1P10PC TaxID=3132292 RepID=UPI0039A39ED4
MQMATNKSFHSMRYRKATLRLAEHAKKRKQQRAISSGQVELIVFFGEGMHDRRGGIRCVMTANALSRLERVLGHTSRLDSLQGCYVILDAVDERTVITVGHLYL